MRKSSEKLLIDRINHHIFYHSLLNRNQYGFLPQKSTVDAAMAAKGFVRETLQQRNYVVMVSLDVNPLKPELNFICYLLALLAHHFLHVSRIRVKSLTFRRLMSYIYIWSTHS